MKMQIKIVNKITNNFVNKSVNIRMWIRMCVRMRIRMRIRMQIGMRIRMQLRMRIPVLNSKIFSAKKWINAKGLSLPSQFVAPIFMTKKFLGTHKTVFKKLDYQPLKWFYFKDIFTNHSHIVFSYEYNRLYNLSQRCLGLRN